MPENRSQIQNSPAIEKFAYHFARWALGITFLSAVSVRFGLWYGGDFAKGFKEFLELTAQVNAYAPDVLIPFLGWSATILEIILGLALIIGFRMRQVALCSAVLLGIFGLSMAISMGIRAPLDYSVFSASSAALLLSVSKPPGQADQNKAADWGSGIAS